jgi:NAD(P)-dependent dehydrogenase (short-subunit alcohol dehydrogenase family)
MATLLVTGANRGLGLEFVRQYAAAGWRVHACCRNPDAAADLRRLADDSDGRVLVHALDVTDFARIDALAAELDDQPIDILLNNAGVYGPNEMDLGHLDYKAWDDVFRVNVLAPIKLAEAFVEHVARSPRRLIACLSSQMGSIGRNGGGRHYLYRSTKAALNAAVRSLAIDLMPRGVTAVVLHPGWVRTDMGGADADMSPEQSVRDVRALLERLTIVDSGKFLDHDGSVIPW